MTDYNFLNLSPADFENVTRDLLQKKMKIHLESFSDGPDGGIDFRYSKDKKNTIVIQCKRYEKFEQLVSNLKKEKENLSKLNPERYILVTSVSLTDNRKKRIETLLSPYLKEYKDIIGKKDLNNLLSLYPEVEKNNFKLWLSGINILKNVLFNKIVNQSIFEKDKFVETQKVYVVNDSFYKAQNILNKNNYVIISGIPGIGKTTLARILVCYYIDKGFDDFIYLSDNIGEAYSLFQEGKKQIFLFDDFLGRTSLYNFTTNEEKRIVALIDKISSSKNKLLVLATREYILRDAKHKYDLFDETSIELSKCVIDLSQYTREVRAKILYNQLFFSDIPYEYIADLMLENRFLNLIKHKSFNPRNIELIKKRMIWNDVKPNQFYDKFMSFIKDSKGIWQHVYENQISELAKCILNLLASTGTPIYYDDLSNLLQKFAKENSTRYDFKYSLYEFKKAINVLQDTFIQVEKDSKKRLLIDFQNPSVQDFIVDYLSSNQELIIDIINSSLFFNQLYTIFSFQGSGINKIPVNDTTYSLITTKIRNDFDYLNNSIIWYFKTSNSSYSNELSDLDKLKRIITEINIIKGSKFEDFVFTRFDQIDILELSHSNKADYIDILDFFKERCKPKAKKIVNDYHNSITTIDEIDEYERIKDIFPVEYSHTLEADTEFNDKILNLVTTEVRDSSHYGLEDLKVKVEKIERAYKVNLTLEKEEIEDKIIERDKAEKKEEVPIIKEKPSEKEMTDKEIVNMFNSLKQ
jgi:hypothetical protein